MVFKLVRTDSEEPCKIQLPSGTHLIGRGKFLDCDDKRVSRNHGELEVVDDTIVMKALHQNPCFYIKKGSGETQILKQACTVNLSNGDKFGLLPNSFWFEVLHCSGVDISRSPEKAADDNTEPLDQTLLGTESTQNRLLFENNTDDQQSNNNGKDDGIADSQITGSPSILPPGTLEAGSPTLTPRETSPERTGDHPPDISAGQVPTSTGGPADQSNQVPKRCLSPVDSKDEVKKIKTEPEVKQEPDARPGPSGDQGSSSNQPPNDGVNMIPGLPPSPAKPAAAPGRERCMYGASCYRRNPQHKVQFAHPSDPDWGPGARGVCPYGAACRKRDPRHWRDHEHPPGVQPPPPNAPAQRPTKKRSKRKESGSDQSDSGSDTPQASLIVTGKRSRKKVKRPSYSGSEIEDDEEDPFGTDDEDEWVPGSQSQYTQDD
ncbi:zinc-finger (CX5CX6HX5H) motif domain-containing protein [Phthorimaea operculella]|nr:zinc-finger (CX5CX6HX5H) motif domain-containing protein [Phthorimaea operculella]